MEAVTLENTSLQPNHVGPTPRELEYCAAIMTGGFLCDYVNCSATGPDGPTIVNIFGKHISGTIPTAISQMPQLLQFTVEENELSGTIPKGLLELGWLSAVDLSYNQFSGSIPTEVGVTGYLRARKGVEGGLLDLKLHSNQYDTGVEPLTCLPSC